MREFDDLVEAIYFGLHHHYKEHYQFKYNNEIYSTESADRYWACRLVPGLYYDLFDETPDDCEEMIDE